MILFVLQRRETSFFWQEFSDRVTPSPTLTLSSPHSLSSVRVVLCAVRTELVVGPEGAVQIDPTLDGVHFVA